MTADELKKKFINFFEKRGHQLIPSASLIPENDPTTLFISAGMHPLVPYLLGEPHPLGKRLCSIQKCLRTVDIDAVGDAHHHTFFEMLGSWSLGDYWKETMIPWSFDFLTKDLQIPVEKISVTCFAGDSDAPKDEETAMLWKKVGIPKERICFLGKEDNWWGPAGQTGPCGPDSEMFYDTGKKSCCPDCKPGCSCGKYFEIWNDVFMTYNKTAEGKYELLRQRNIDTGMGVDRTTTVLSGFDDSYRTDLFWPIIRKIEEISGKSYEDDMNKKPMRVIADHIRAATFVIADGIYPSNTEHGYVLRRLIRRAVEFGELLQINKSFTGLIAEVVIREMGDVYPEILDNKNKVLKDLPEEEESFKKEKSAHREGKEILRRKEEMKAIKEGTISPEEVERGLLSKYAGKYAGQIDIDSFLQDRPYISTASGVAGTIAFDQKSTYGMPIKETEDILKNYIDKFSKSNFDQAFQDIQQLHQKVSRASVEQKFAGGLADHSEIATKYHTATHLLHAALREILGKEVHQAGSNITAERLRFDFTYSQKPTDEQIKKAREIVNQKIKEDLPVTMEVMSLSEAQKLGAMAFFEQKYSKQVKVYSIGPSTGSGFPFSREICAGPHVTNTGEIGEIEIFKEESSGTGKRRIYARMK